MRITLALLALLALAGAAQEDPMIVHVEALRKRLPGPEFGLVVEPPFVVLGDLPAPELHSHALHTVRWATTRLKKEYFAKDPPILDVWLFRDDESYRKHVQALTGNAPETPFGFYSPADHGLFMNIHTGGGTLVHEIVHPYIHVNFPECPPWFNEGLASLYEQSADHDGRIWGLPNWRLPALQEAIRAHASGSFEALTQLNNAGFYGEGRSLHYAQARYLCLYLQEHGKLRDFYHRFVADANEDPTGLKTLRATVGDLPAFQRPWEAWVMTLKF